MIDLCRRSHGTNDDHVDLVVELAALIDKASEVNPDQELIDQLVENFSWNADDAGFDLGFEPRRRPAFFAFFSCYLFRQLIDIR